VDAERVNDSASRSAAAALSRISSAVSSATPLLVLVGVAVGVPGVQPASSASDATSGRSNLFTRIIETPEHQVPRNNKYGPVRQAFPDVQSTVSPQRPRRQWHRAASPVPLLTRLRSDVSRRRPSSARSAA